MYGIDAGLIPCFKDCPGKHHPRYCRVSFRGAGTEVNSYREMKEYS